MLEIKNTTIGWAIEFDDVRVLTALERGLESRIENNKRLLERSHIRDIESAETEIKELEELLEKVMRGS